MAIDIKRVQALVGPITEADMRFVESFYCDTVGLFIPSLGQCEYAVSNNHIHPSYMIVILRDLFANTASLPDIPFNGSGDFIASAISPGIPHTETESEDFTRYFALFVSPTLFESVWRTYDASGPPRLEWSTWTVAPGIQGLFRDFMVEFENNLPGREPLMQAIALRIIHHLIRSCHHISVNSERITTRAEVAKALEVMHLRFGDKISVKEVAGLAGMSESHFSRVFKSETGQPPLEKLNEIRLRRAKQMLDTTRRAISEVAVDCGFATPSHFSTAFSKAFGISPSKYRKGLENQYSQKNESL